jgi:hypothetical protein
MNRGHEERMLEGGKCGLEIKRSKMGSKNRQGGSCFDVMRKSYILLEWLLENHV